MIVSVYGPRRDECHVRLLILVSIGSYDTLSGKLSIHVGCCPATDLPHYAEEEEEEV